MDDPFSVGSQIPSDQKEAIRIADILFREIAKEREELDALEALATLGSGRSPMGRKPDINQIAQDVFQIKKMLADMFTGMGIPLPPEVLK